MKVTMNHKDYSERQLEGHVDGGTIHILCSNCKAPLVDVLVTKPEENYNWEIQADCPFCSDKSFKTKIHGLYFLGHTEYTSFVDTICDGTNVEVKTSKGDKEWQL